MNKFRYNFDQKFDKFPDAIVLRFFIDLSTFGGTRNGQKKQPLHNTTARSRKVENRDSHGPGGVLQGFAASKSNKKREERQKSEDPKRARKKRPEISIS